QCRGCGCGDGAHDVRSLPRRLPWPPTSVLTTPYADFITVWPQSPQPISSAEPLVTVALSTVGLCPSVRRSSEGVLFDSGAHQREVENPLGFGARRLARFAGRTRALSTKRHSLTSASTRSMMACTCAVGSSLSEVTMLPDGWHQIRQRGHQ